jgi:DNA modification methylase
LGKHTTYLRDLVLIFQQIYRATKASGSLWVVLDTFKTHGALRLLPFELADRLRAEPGWLLQDIIVWDKCKTLPWSRQGQLRNQFEYLMCFSKSRPFKYHVDRLKELDLKEWWVKYPERYNPRGKVPTNIWKFPIPVQGSWSSNGLRHACPFPTALVEKLILLTTDAGDKDLVLDPFAGSGVVLAVAEQMGRSFLGFELNSTFVEAYRRVVRRSVKREWTHRPRHYSMLEERPKVLQEQILRLRLTKYPERSYGSCSQLLKVKVR